MIILRDYSLLRRMTVNNRHFLYGDIGDIIGGWLGFGSSAMDNETQKAINAANIAMQRETNAMNERLFHENLDFQSSERKDQNQVNWKNAVDMFNMENQYNSPAAQMQRLIAAGLNPAAVTGSPTATGSSPSVGSSVSSGLPNLVSPRAEMIEGIGARTIANIQGLTSAVSNISHSALSSAQKDEILGLLPEKIRGLTLDNDAQKIYNDLQIQFGSKTKQAEYDLLIKSAAYKMSEIELNKEMSETEKTKQLDDISSSLLKDADRLLKKEELKVFTDKWNTQKLEALSRIRLNNANSVVSGTQATLNQERVRTEQKLQALHASTIKLQDSIRQLNNNQNAYEVQTLQNRILMSAEELNQSEILTEQGRKDLQIIQTKLEQAVYSNDKKAITYWSNLLFDFSNTVSNGVGSVGSFVGAVKGLPSVPFTHQQSDADDVVVDDVERHLDSYGNPADKKTQRRYHRNK